MVVRHFVGPAHARGALEKAANLRLGAASRRRDVAHPRRTETFGAAEQRRAISVQAASSAGESRTCVRRQAQEGAVEDERAGAGELLHGGVEGRLRQPRLKRHPQRLAADALKVRIVGVMGCDPFERVGGEGRPRLGQERDLRTVRCQGDEVERRRERLRALVGEAPVAGVKGEIGGERRGGQERGECSGRVRDRQRRALRLPLRRPALPRRRPQIEEASSAERALRR